MGDHVVCDLSENSSLEKSLAFLSEGKSFVLKAQVVKTAKLEISSDFDVAQYFTDSGHSKNQDFEKLLSFIDRLPSSFFHWTESKSFNPKDFRCMIKDFDQSRDTIAFEQIAKLNPTKSSGLQIIEYYFDLLAIKKIEPSYVLDFRKPEALLLSLKRKRFSNTLDQDELFSSKLSKLDLAQSAKVFLRREGDQRLLHLEVKSPSPEALAKDLTMLQKKISDLQDLWNK
jgi:hypothetical protein